MEKIDLTPTWTQSIIMLITVLENGTKEGKTEARRELIRIGNKWDEYLESINNNNKNQQS